MSAASATKSRERNVELRRSMTAARDNDLPATGGDNGKATHRSFYFRYRNATGNEWPGGAVINNGGGVKGTPCEDSDGNGVCQEWCHLHNIYAKSQQKCDRKCWASYCKIPFTEGKPVKGTGAGPIVNGKPVQAPPPKGGNSPTKGGNAAPIVNGNPVQASPGGTDTGHPILERGEGGGRH
jgi:hypothetical protein